MSQETAVMSQAPTHYTIITFSPVQSFIEKSRKLRDLYGSSFILSYLAKAIGDAADAYDGCKVVSPALLNTAQGTPNQIIIRGDYPEAEAKQAFYGAWRAVVKACQDEIEQQIPAGSDLRLKPNPNSQDFVTLDLGNWRYTWNRSWNAWKEHTWEFFWEQSAANEGQVAEIAIARQRLIAHKQERAWTGVNWHGESSTLSGADAIAWYGLDATRDPKTLNQREQGQKIAAFYQALADSFDEAILDPTERLSIPELTKRMVTLDAIARKRLNLADADIPKTFRNLNRLDPNPEKQRWTGWFMGDGDRIGNYLNRLKQQPDQTEESALEYFSQAMLLWGQDFQNELPTPSNPKNPNVPFIDGRVIYAGGDDFMGVLYRTPPDAELRPKECLAWLYTFPKIWERHGEDITASIGFVWAAPGVPQRDVLQNCREAEKSAKDSGRDRLALRILFNGGNQLEWTCPWEYVEKILTSYRDREGKTGDKANWTHLFNDVAMLESRHGFEGQTDVALSLFGIYFGEDKQAWLKDEQRRWNQVEKQADGSSRVISSGLLGDRDRHQGLTPVETRANEIQALNDWVINLARVGFHFHRPH